MTKSHERNPEAAVLRDRLKKLSEASLRINESLEFDAVLQEAVDSARSLTDARYGMMALLDDAGQAQVCITSGFTPYQSGRLWFRPERDRLFEHFSNITEPLRLRDLHSHTRSQGLPEFRPQVPLSPSPALLAAPIHYGGKSVGTFYLCEKEGRDAFTAEDEETLITFAAQAALVIANARRHRDERQARLDLETLIDTSPVGVAVFSAKSGELLSFNREARRIVEDLCAPGSSAEHLLKVLTFLRADGRKISLQEFSLVQALSTGETVRAEEIVLTVPDGRSVTALVNATPIRSEEGEIESYVVTIQDMTPVEDLERLRAEFLGMVSHELRIPLTSIKGSTTALLDDSSILDPAEMRQFHRIIDHQADRMRDMISDLLDVAQIETGSLSVVPDPTDLAAIVEQARSTYLSGGGSNNIEFDLPPNLPWVMVDRRRVVQVLYNLLTNAARYSEASTAIRLAAVQEDFHVEISVSDEGSGVTADLLPHLFRKFSRTDGESRNHDTGLGLAICKGIVEAHGGRIWAESDGPGRGTKVAFTVPVAEEVPASPALAGGSKPEHSDDKDAERRRILAVDDDPQTLKSVREILTKAGYTPIVTADPGEIADLIELHKPSLVLLDLILPDTDGFELMGEVVKVDKVPVIVLSGYGREDNIARAFESGASDYIVKPFSPTELVARINAALKKEADPVQAEPEIPYVYRELTLDYRERRVTLGGREVQLTRNEYRMLHELTASRGRVVTHEALLRRIWGARHGRDLRHVRSLVRRLRHKLGDNGDDPKYIFTEHGVGYRIGKPEGPETASTKA